MQAALIPNDLAAHHNLVIKMNRLEERKKGKKERRKDRKKKERKKKRYRFCTLLFSAITFARKLFVVNLWSPN